MRNKALLFAMTLMAALPVSCDSGEKKAAFDQYEAAVSGTLEEEAELRNRYEEEFANMQAYQTQDAFDQLVRQEMIPFYAEMKKKVEAVSPEDMELRKIHSLLIQYATLASEMVELDTKTSAVADMEAPALERLNKAMNEREKATREFNEAVSALPTLMEKLREMFVAEQRLAVSVIQSLAMVREGEASAAAFLDGMDNQVDPFYEKVVQKLAEMKVSADEQVAMLKVKAYVGSTMACFIAAREVAAVRPRMLEELKPLRERLLELQEETTRLLNEYREKARAYRDSLR